MKNGCITLVVFVVLYYLVAYFICSIDPEQTYTWNSGIWHGIFWIPNLIMSLFSDAVYFKAPLCTTGYTICFYATIVISSIISSVINSVLNGMNK